MNTNQPPKTYAEGDIMQLLTALLQQRQLQQRSKQADNGHVKIPTPPLYDGARDQYINDFQNILLELYIAENEAMDKFSRGLKDQARTHVLLKDPIDLESMYQCARTFESAIQYNHSVS
ncbi:hypothetical protein INT47_013042 [Mucor saturninus]|uniref:Uncharacterized protein n=1 Tax=Mucor saturninus TaxID=64648 RepID=A0A8H7QI27_9FUNG|nr:hypothetical protein INT47_013042 [Mucor saturninus]